MENNNKSVLSVALVGCGRISVKHLKAILKQKDSFNLCALVDPVENAPETLLGASGIKGVSKEEFLSKVRIYKDFSRMLESEKPDIVSITVPSGLHYEMAKSALLSGSHVFLEKPMTMKISEAAELVELSASTGRKIVMGHIYRYFPVIGLIQRDLSTGLFGSISHGAVTVRWGHDQQYYDQAAWRGTWKYDGGALMNQTIHALDLMCWLMSSTPEYVTGFLAKRSRNIEAEDTGMAVIRMKSGALCQVEGTTATSPRDHEASFFINGASGSVRIGLRNGIPSLDVRDAKGKRRKSHYLIEQIKTHGLSSLLRAGNPHYAIYQDLYHSISVGKEPIADAGSGLMSVSSVLAVYLSAKENKVIHLPLDHDFSTEEMIGFFDAAIHI